MTTEYEPDQRLRVGVVGCGIGREHLKGYAGLPAMFDVRAICDVDAARAETLAAEYGITRITTDFAVLCGMDDLDVIDICTPSFLHFEQSLQALAAHKHVICEKPAAASLSEVDELVAAEANSGRRMMPIFQYRFGRGLQKLKFLVDQGIAGRAYLATSETLWRRRSAYYAVPWRGKWQTELGGPLVTLAIHAHDSICYILGPAMRAAAHAATMVNAIETDDCITASLEMAGGALCSLSVTTGSSAQVSRQRYCFSNLSAESNIEAYANTREPWIFTGDSPEAEARMAEALAGFTPLPEGFAGQLYRFHQALRNVCELPVTLDDARASAELITALYCSAATHTMVTLPIARDHPWYGGWRRAQGMLKVEGTPATGQA